MRRRANNASLSSNNRQRGASSSAMSGISTPWWVLIAPVVVMSLVLIFTGLAFLLPPPKGGNPILQQLPFPPTTTVSSSSTSQTGTTFNTGTTTTAISSTSTSLTTPAGTTTTPAEGLSIICPPNITVPLGSNIVPPASGVPNVTNTDPGTCGTPVWTFTDENVSPPAPTPSPLRKKRRLLGERDQQSKEIVDLIGQPLQAQWMGHFNKYETAPLTSDDSNKRSLAFPNSYLNPTWTPPPVYEVSNTGSDKPNPTMVSNGEYVVIGYDTPTMGTVITVLNADQTSVLGMFSLASMGTGPCATGGGMGQILWDEDVQMWFMVERSGVSTPPYYACFYMSMGSNPFTSMYKTYMISFGFNAPNALRMAVWGDVYALTFDSSVNNCCVIDRTELCLNNTFNAFCATPTSGTLSGFSHQIWTPMSSEGDTPAPPVSTQNANGIGPGAVFMRHRDDELHDGFNTPEFDVIDVEHWSNINFTTFSYTSLRYSIDVDDFDSSFGGCLNEDSCISTASSSVPLAANQQMIMHPLAYRSLANGEQTAVATWTSHANNYNASQVRWVRLVWRQPTPLSAPQWVNDNEGVISSPDLSRWNPAAVTDINGTIAIVYNIANATLVPGLAASYRVLTDEASGMRHERITPFATGDPGLVPSGQSDSAAWGRYMAISTWPGAHEERDRWFYVFAPHVKPDAVNGTWTVTSFRMLVGGEVIKRTFLGQDLCNGNGTTCHQYISLM